MTDGVYKLIVELLRALNSSSIIRLEGSADGFKVIAYRLDLQKIVRVDIRPLNSPEDV